MLEVLVVMIDDSMILRHALSQTMANCLPAPPPGSPAEAPRGWAHNHASGHRSQLEERDLQWHERGDLAEVRRCGGQAGVEATFQNDRHLRLTVHDPN